MLSAELMRQQQEQHPQVEHKPQHNPQVEHNNLQQVAVVL
jgi:hypothetical protein